MARIKKRILLISPFCHPSVGGAETHLADLYEYLRTHDYFVYVVTYQPITVDLRGKSLEKKKNLEIHRFSWFGHNLFFKLEKHHPIFNFLYLTPYLLLRSFLFMLTHRKKIEVIHAHGLNASFIAVLLKKLFKKRAVMSTMALYSFKRGSLFSRVTARILSSLDKVIAETEESKEELVKIGVPQEKVVVFSHWVNQNQFKPEDKKKAKKRLGWQGKFVALFVGRAIPIKGGDTLTKVVAKINPQINLAVIADAGPQLDLFKKTAQKYPNFIFVGGVPYKRLHAYYKAADIFVIPSRYEEGAARVMLEAVSCGVPVVASSRGAIPSVLDESVAVFVDPDEKSIRRAIEELYRQPRKLKELAKNCFPFATKHFGFENAKIVTASYQKR
jgi:glycosyltransferase involved in cell wall biosynthesis